MAHTCSGIYFWDPSSPSPRAPRARFVDWNPFFSRLNSMVTLVVLFIGCVPSLRRRATTATAHTTAAPHARPLSGGSLSPHSAFLYIYFRPIIIQLNSCGVASPLIDQLRRFFHILEDFAREMFLSHFRTIVSRMKRVQKNKSLYPVPPEM